jgi:two-component system, cell cycle response regulator
MNAFLAEDDIVTRHLLQTLLSRWGYTLLTAEDGTSAIEMLPSLPIPTVVLLDWMMPGMAGTDVCRKLRQLYSTKNAYVIMLTALNQPEDVVEGLESGADDYLCKPVTPVELRARLQIGTRILSIESELMSARRNLVYEITHDEMTGLLSQNSILKVLAGTIDQSLHENVPLAIGLVQIDSRRARSMSLELETAVVGQAAESLAVVTENVLSSVRSYDAIGRFGDNSFLAIFPGVGRSGAMNLAMRLLAGLSRTTTLVPTFANIGVASTDGASDYKVDNLVQAAEQALRVAIANGPNRIEFAPVRGGLILPSHLADLSVQH